MSVKTTSGAEIPVPWISPRDSSSDHHQLTLTEANHTRLLRSIVRVEGQIGYLFSCPQPVKSTISALICDCLPDWSLTEILSETKASSYRSN